MMSMPYLGPPPETFERAPQALTLSDLKDEMSAFGLMFLGQPVADGKFHRIPGPGSKSKSDNDGFYVVNILRGGLICATYGDWHWQDQWQNWSSKSMSSFTSAEKSEFDQHHDNMKFEQERSQAEAAHEATRIWNSAFPGAERHPYLELKNIQPHGAKIADDDRLVVPVCIDGQITSIQYIGADGKKMFLSQGKISGGSFLIPGNGQTVIVCEGYSTAASLAEATGITVYCAFNAGNLENVVAAIKSKHQQIIIAGDDDKWTDGNPGRTAAEAAAKRHGCKVVFPKFSDEATRPTDFNDMAAIDGLDAVREASPRSASTQCQGEAPDHVLSATLWNRACVSSRAEPSRHHL